MIPGQLFGAVGQSMVHFFRRLRLKIFGVSAVAIVLWIFCMPSFQPLERGGDTVYVVSLGGKEVGSVGSKARAEECLQDARRRLAGDAAELVLSSARLEYRGQELMWGELDAEEDIISRMTDILRQSRYSTMDHCYTLKINKYSVNLASLEEVQRLLETALGRFDTEGEYSVELVSDTTREVNVLTTSVISERQAQWRSMTVNDLPTAGIVRDIDRVIQEAQPVTQGDSLEDFTLGMITMDFGEKVEVTEGYFPREEITDLGTAIEDVTKDKETNQIYEVKSGDTLGSIALEYGLSLEELIAMNESLEDENSTIRPGDEFIVTVPEPELSVVYETQEYYEEDYEAEVEYIDNDKWYTTQTKVIQEPSAGHRNVVARVVYKNGVVQGEDVLYEDVIYPAVPKIVERGTIVPPTYIKPISGGRLTSGFGRRSRPTKGASSYHKGVDWATPVGTAVVASNGGVVTRAGWGSGYGYCVYIHHSDGRDTRYGHLSKVLVKVGQTVKQGEKIALSGNTGVTTGPHLHFEILIGGSQVNPLNYLN